MKRLVSLVLAISMVFSMFVSVFASTTFEDVAGTKYAGAVEALVELGVIIGMPDGTFKPNENVTRAQLAKMLVICLGLEDDDVNALKGRTIFSDVEESYWANGYINAAVQSKVIAGYPDGTFKPEKEVSYAEAVTMVIRVLGWANVVEKKGGVWPTSYMLQAAELELLDDIEKPVAGEAATRGNIAILLWNMLNTPMWRITEESEGNGMTSRADEVMLDVKFPDYKYYENVYVASVDVDNNEVTATVTDESLNVNGKSAVTAAIKDVDLSRLVIGSEVSALVKNYKEKEEATFLTLTPANTFVEGLVTKEPTSSKIEIEGVEYKLADADKLNGDQAVTVDSYVVVEVDGKKVSVVNDRAVLKVLETEAKEVEKIKSMEKVIDEDAIVIIDGEWAERKNIEVGDVYTEMSEFGDSYYMVSRERVEGTFESLTRKKDNEENLFIEVDGEQYKAFADVLTNNIFEGEDNEDVVELSALEAKEKENKYLDKDVELVFNYLGQVIKVYFGEVSEIDADGEFYVVMSNGTWYSSSSSGKQNHIVLAGVNGEEETYDLAKGATIPDALKEDVVYASGEPVFVWVNFNDNGEIKNLVVLEDGLESGDEGYKGDLNVASFSGDLNDDNYLETTSGYKKVSASTVVITATPVEDDDEKVIGFEIEVTQGTEALDGVKGGLVAYNPTKVSTRARYVFVSEEAKSQELHFGKVESARQSRGIVYATISEEEYEVNLDDSIVGSYNGVKGLVDLLVAFTEDNGKVVLKKTYANTDLDKAGIVTSVEDEFVTYEVREVREETDNSGNTVVNVSASGETLDVTSEDVKENFKKYSFVSASADTEKDGNEVEFNSDVEFLGKGIENAKFKKGDRISIDDYNKIVVIVSGFKADENILDGKLIVE